MDIWSRRNDGGVYYFSYSSKLGYKMTDKDYMGILENLIEQHRLIGDEHRFIHISKNLAESLLDLARKGIWSRDKAIPAFKLIKEKRFTTKLPMEIRLDVVKDIAKEALEALPSEGK